MFEKEQLLLLLSLLLFSKPFLDFAVLAVSLPEKVRKKITLLTSMLQCVACRRSYSAPTQLMFNVQK